jgi:murein peptide amidase A
VGAARSNAIVAKRVIGRSVQGRPIIAYRKGNPRAALRVVILGQMHGDEPAGPVTARYIIRHVPVSLRADVWIVPTMNPDGRALGTRQNARGVDLNRNWPMRWRPGPRGGCCYPGPRPASEPETRAMLRFLDHIHPRFLASIHQPYGEIGRYPKKNRRFQRRLSRQLHLPLAGIGVGGSSGAAPTLTGWYNQLHRGTAITVEYTAHPSLRYQRRTAGYGLLRAELAY